MADLAAIAVIEQEANTGLFDGINTLRACVGLPLEFNESERMKIQPRFHDRYTGARFKQRCARAIAEVIKSIGDKADDERVAELSQLISPIPDAVATESISGHVDSVDLGIGINTTADHIVDATKKVSRPKASR